MFGGPARIRTWDQYIMSVLREPTFAKILHNNLIRSIQSTHSRPHSKTETNIEIVFLLLSFFDTMNENKGGKNEKFITSIILGGNCFNSTFVVDVVFWTRN